MTLEICNQGGVRLGGDGAKGLKTRIHGDQNLEYLHATGRED